MGVAGVVKGNCRRGAEKTRCEEMWGRENARRREALMDLIDHVASRSGLWATLQWALIFTGIFTGQQVKKWRTQSCCFPSTAGCPHSSLPPPRQLVPVPTLRRRLDPLLRQAQVPRIHGLDRREILKVPILFRGHGRLAASDLRLAVDMGWNGLLSPASHHEPHCGDQRHDTQGGADTNSCPSPS